LTVTTLSRDALTEPVTALPDGKNITEDDMITDVFPALCLIRITECEEELLGDKGDNWMELSGINGAVPLFAPALWLPCQGH
jgi:hypothetical protein